MTGVGVPPDKATGKKSERHAWNVVIIDGTPYAVDVTFDTSLSTEKAVCCRYFNVSDEVMARDHADVDRPVAACPVTMKRGFRC